jgi:alpha-glucosidase (family GH31 glycosyl hydrolase)
MQLVGGFTAQAQSEPGRLDATADPYAVGRVNEIKDQYMLGDSLLVAPIPPGVKSRKVVLPAGRWYDFYTGELAGEGQTVEVSPPLSRIPLFVRDGGLVPLIGERQWAPGRDEVLPLEVRHYGGRAGEMWLYDDDGETFDYERGEYTWTRLRVARDASGALRGEVTPGPGGKRWRYSEVRWTFMTK